MSRSGSTVGSEGDNLMRGRLVTPSGMVPPSFEEDVISSLNVSVSVSLASGNVSNLGGVGTVGPPNPSLGQFSDPSRQDLDQSRARGAPGYGILHDSISRDVRNVAPSPSPSFNPTSLLFPCLILGLPLSLLLCLLCLLLPFLFLFLLLLLLLCFLLLFLLLLFPFSLFLLWSLLFSLFPLLPLFPLFLFSSFLFLSTLLPLLPLPLLVFLPFLLLLSLRLLFDLLRGFRLLPLFLNLCSLPLLLLWLLLSPQCLPLLLSLLGGPLRGSLLSFLCLPLLLRLGILRIFRLGYWVFLRNIRL